MYVAYCKARDGTGQGATPAEINEASPVGAAYSAPQPVAIRARSASVPRRQRTLTWPGGTASALNRPRAPASTATTPRISATPDCAGISRGLRSA